MTERESDDSTQPRKRIAVACGRCRKRKIRCSGDPGNGGPCSNCKNAGHEPCLFLRVSSTETPLRDSPSDFGYNVEAARTYHARGAVSPHHSVAQYSTDMSGSDMMNYRQSTYPYNNSKGYYSTVPGWSSGAYGDDSVDYGLNYSPYPQMSQDPVHIVPSYRYSSSGKTPVYVDPEASSYSYGNLVHRPAVNHDLPTLSLSGHYSNSKSSASQASDASYTGLNSSFDAYGAATLAPNVPARSSHADAVDSIYGSDHTSYRSVHEPDSYIYNGRRDSQASSGVTSASVLSNGQVYIPDAQLHASSHGYSISGSNSAAVGIVSQSGGINEATTATSTGGGCATSQAQAQAQAAGQRRSAGGLRGA